LDATGSCELTYSPSIFSSGTDEITARYSGDPTHARSSARQNIDVYYRFSATSVSCLPVSVEVGKTSTCAVTVSDDDTGTPSTPNGTVSFSSDGSGGFSDSGECDLDSSGSCTLTYTASAVGTGTHEITAAYDGDDIHDTSEDQTTISVRPKPSQAGTTGAGGIVRQPAPTGRRAAALKKCSTQHSKKKRRKCRKNALLLPV
jgi:hypothetical protein